MDDVDQGLVWLLKDSIPTFGLREFCRHRSLVRFVASKLPFSPNIRPFSQIDHGIILHDVKFVISKQYDNQSDEIDLNISKNDHNISDCDLQSDWGSTQLFDIASLQMPEPKHVLSRTSLCVGDEDIESAFFSRDAHDFYQRSVCSQNADERIDMLEIELNLLRSQLECLVSNHPNKEQTSPNNDIDSETLDKLSLIPPPPPPLEYSQTLPEPNKTHDLLGELQTIKLKPIDLANSPSKSIIGSESEKDIGEFLTESLQQKFGTLSLLNNSDLQNDSMFSSMETSLNESSFTNKDTSTNTQL